MSQGPQVFPAWTVAEGAGTIQADVRTGLYCFASGVRGVRSCDHEAIDAESYGFVEVEFSCDVSGELELKWERGDAPPGGPLCAPVQSGQRTLARFPLYAEPDWSGWINSVRITFPTGLSEGMVGPLRLFGFSDLEPRDLQRFARASATMEVTKDEDLRVSLRYNGVYLAPMDTSKSVQVSLRDERSREILSVTKPARGNYDAAWIEVDFVFPNAAAVPAAKVFLIDNQTGHSIVCHALVSETSV